MFTLCVISFFAAITGALIGQDMMWRSYNKSELFAFGDIASIYLAVSLLFGLASLGAFIYLCIAVGDRDGDGKVIPKTVDRIYTEIQLVIITVMFLAGGGVFINFSIMTTIDAVVVNGIVMYNNFIGLLYEPAVITILVACVIGVIAAVIGLWMLMSCIRKIKAGTFLRQSIIGKICIYFYETVYLGGSLMRKTMLAAIVACVLSATVVLAPVVLILLIIFLPKLVREYDEIKRGVEEVKSGNLGYKIPLTGRGEFDKLSQGINEISQSTNAAVQNEMKNQKMKAELISNVSHDLKTPLTSMVTYIDLLKTEGLKSKNAQEYLDILDQKTDRLKQLTDDLFEAAKASSGAIPMRKEKVDMLSLINQGLGEMNQKVAESGLEMIVKADLEKYYVWADGQLLWRVVENLLGNVLKYAQENSRVYINLSEQGAADNPTMSVIEIKNISKQALNIEADELMERFKRGDEARSTEGSGLGLAIAKDLVKLQGGWLEIKIDGDLFKATVMLEKAE